MSGRTFALLAGAATSCAGLLQLVGDTVYAIDRVYPGDPGFAFANLVAAVWHVLLLIGVLALPSVGGERFGRLGRAGTIVAAIGMVTLISAEIATQVAGAIPVPLIAASAPLTGIGLVLAGVALLRDPRRRFLAVAALATGVYALAVIVPTSVGPGGANYFVIAGWGALWLLLGIGIIGSALRDLPVTASARRVSPA
ncbi:hypothetical protein [Microbacterium sp.]|uniref:hypothetical protein n=1 Tax=Microbacterium sp. TaxID=51671 RepID=UPI003C741190